MLSPHAMNFKFASKVNSGNVRMYNLMRFSKVTIMYEFPGTRFGKLDILSLKIFKIFRSIIIFKMRKKPLSIHVMSPVDLPPRWHSQILHLDDPEFSSNERIAIAEWYKKLKNKNLNGLIIVTFEGAKEYILGIDSTIPVEIVPQGFTHLSSSPDSFAGIACVYSSPYIFYREKGKIPHPTWDAQHFIDDLIPRILEIDSKISIHLIGRASMNAKAALRKYPEVYLHGLVSPEENVRILRKCHIGLYPRQHDHRRRVLKITEYLGAGLPIVAYELEDTKLVSELGVGLTARSPIEFVEKLKLLVKSPEHTQSIKMNIEQAKIGLDWQTLAERMDYFIQSRMCP